MRFEKCFTYRDLIEAPGQDKDLLTEDDVDDGWDTEYGKGLKPSLEHSVLCITLTPAVSGTLSVIVYKAGVQVGETKVANLSAGWQTHTQFMTMAPGREYNVRLGTDGDTSIIKICEAVCES